MSETLQTSGRKVVEPPTRDKWFKVDPKKINWELFEEKRQDPEQEATRDLINRARCSLKSNPELYGRKFETKRVYDNPWRKYPAELEARVYEQTKRKIALIPEQAFEIAQRISNGETWEELCNNPDTEKYSRLVAGMGGCGFTGHFNDGEYYLFGGEKLGSPANYKRLIRKGDVTPTSRPLYENDPGNPSGKFGEDGDKLSGSILILVVRHFEIYESRFDKKLKNISEPMIKVKF